MVCHCRNWATRNNSSNVAALLKPEENQNQACYCREKGAKPKLFAKPNSCPCDEAQENKSPQVKVVYPDEMCLCWRKDGLTFRKNAAPQGKYDFSGYCSKDHANNALKTCLNANNPEKNEKKPRKIQVTPDHSFLQAYFDPWGTNEKKPVGQSIAIQTDETPRSALWQTNDPTHRNSRENQLTKNLKEISDFRKDNYFETHSVENLTRPKIDVAHKCIHCFELDDRFLLKSLNANAFEQSECLICGKLMVNPVNKKWRGENGAPEYYAKGLVPRKVYIGNGDYVLGVEEPKEFGWRNKRPNYFNTLALKYQKGVFK